MLTKSQKRQRATRVKTGLCILVAALVFTPNLDGLDLGSWSFPLIATATAAPLD